MSHFFKLGFICKVVWFDSVVLERSSTQHSLIWFFLLLAKQTEQPQHLAQPCRSWNYPECNPCAFGKNEMFVCVVRNEAMNMNLSGNKTMVCSFGENLFTWSIFHHSYFTKGVNADKKCFLMNKIELSFFECYRCVCWGWVGWWYFLSTEQTEIDKL